MKITISVEASNPDEAQNILNRITGTAAISLPTGGASGTAGNSEDDDGSSSNDDVTGKVDKDGLPWDGRIHSSNKKITAKGVWTRRKGVDDAVFNQIAGELRGAASAPAQQPQFHQPAPQGAPLQPLISGGQYVGQPAPNTLPPTNGFPNPNAAAPIGQPQPDLSQFTQAAPPQQVQQPVQQQQFQQPAPLQQAQPAPAAAGGRTINDLFTKITQLLQTGTPADYVNSLTSRLSQTFQVQVNNINDIAAQPAMIEAAFNLIATDGK